MSDIRDKAESLRHYCEAAGLGLVMQNRCAEVKLRAERKAGELLAEMPKNPGGRSTSDTLSQVGVQRHQSSRWQRIASLPDHDFENYVTEAVESGRVEHARAVGSHPPPPQPVGSATHAHSRLKTLGRMI